MKSKISVLLFLGTFLGAFVLGGCERGLAQGDDESEAAPRVDIPMYFPKKLTRGEEPKVDPRFSPSNLTIVPEIQEQLDVYIRDHGNPIAAVVLIDVKTGGILAMSQGRDPKEWGATTHSALHTGFPTASLFKTIVAAAGFEIADLEANAPIGLTGGCADVAPQGSWMRQGDGRYTSNMTLHRAYGHSCNGFFAKIAVNQIGLGSIAAIAKRFGWDGQSIPADFSVPISPIRYPNPTTSSVHTVGRFAAGFGYVGISAVHAAWQFLALANDGRARPVRLFKNLAQVPVDGEALVSPETAREVRGLMDATVLGGTASFAFRNSKYRKLRHLAGGKTGTLTGHSPKGLTTWFAGMMPLQDPQVVVATVVILEDLWRFKASNLGAEAFSAYADHMKNLNHVSSVGKNSPAL